MNKLKERIHDDTNGLDYALAGDYYIPDVQMPKVVKHDLNIELEPMKKRPLGKYGRIRRAFLQENNTLLYNHLILTGKLFPHLWEIQETATARMEQLMEELLKQNPAPDKKTNQLGWVQHMSSLRAEAEELICDELIYS